jgi:hypothetical protein
MPAPKGLTAADVLTPSTRSKGLTLAEIEAATATKADAAKILKQYNAHRAAGRYGQAADITKAIRGIKSEAATKAAVTRKANAKAKAPRKAKATKATPQS